MAHRGYGVGHEIGLGGIDHVAFLSANFFNLSSVSTLAKYKLVFFGDQSVGKSSIIMRFKYDHFVNIYKPTIGNDFFTETMYHEDRKIKLQLWDISGQEKFNRYMLCYVHNSSVAIIIYDVARRESFLNTPKWTEEVRTKRGSDVIIVLVGNKTDLVDERQVSIEEGEAKAQELGVMFIETSAKTGLNIKDLFTKIAAALPESPRKQEDIDKADLNRTLIFFGPNSIYHNQPKL